MKTTFTMNGMIFESNEAGTHFYATWNGKKQRIKKHEFEQAQRELALIEAKETEITPEDIERDARELEAYIANAEEDAKTEEGKEIADLYCRKPEGTDLQVPAVLNRYGCVDCSKCNVQNCVHRDCMRRNPTSEGGLAECPRLKVKAEQPKAKKVCRSKDIAFKYRYNTIDDPEGDMVTLTAKQVDFLHEMVNTMAWDGFDHPLYVDLLVDEIGGQFAGKPMTVGAMISTLCEKSLGERKTTRRDNHKCTSFTLSPRGVDVAEALGL